MKQWTVQLKRLALLSLCGIFAVISLSGFTINNIAPGAAGSMTPIALGTTTPVPVVKCGQVLGAVTQAIQMCCYSANAGSVYYNFGLPATATPCATASPAPNSGTPVGGRLALALLQPSNTTPLYGGCQNFNPTTYGGGQSIFNGELDAVADVGGVSCYPMTLP